MHELQLNKSLYDQAAIDSAVETYAPFGTLQVADGDTHVTVSIESDRFEPERLAGELANFALVATIEARGTN